MGFSAAILPSCNVIGLCAGVGGLDLAVRLALPAARTICYVEREVSAAASLVASMAAGRLHQASIWSDLATFDARPWRGIVDIVASGDPCQPNSNAGKRGGASDDRFLIDQVLRVVDQCRPFRLFRENVPGNADGQLAAIVPPLEQMGYRVAAGIFSSRETGASHQRERLFIMADADGVGFETWRHGHAGDDGGTLTQQINSMTRWPTPTARIFKGGGPATTRKDGKSRMDMLDWAAEFWEVPASLSLGLQVPNGSSCSPSDPTLPQPLQRRKLNPLFVEALMRWPTGLSGFDTAATGLTQWLGPMRSYVLMLCSARQAANSNEPRLF